MEKQVATLPEKIKTDEADFLDHWQEIDIIRQFDAEELEGALDQPVRKAIISILSEGRQITDRDGNERTLRVMNASQLLDAINKIAEETNKYGLEKIKRSNLYYHLNALNDRGFITEVGLIPKKNRLISYYGRTARVFLLNYDRHEKASIFDDPNLPTLISDINPDLSGDEITDVINGMKQLYRDVDTAPIHTWVEENERQLRSSEVDIRELHNIFHKLLSFDDQTIAAMRRFAKALKLDLNHST